MKETAYFRLKTHSAEISENLDECTYNIQLLMDTAEYQSMSLTGRRKLSGAKSAIEKAINFIGEFIDYMGYERRKS